MATPNSKSKSKSRSKSKRKQRQKHRNISFWRHNILLLALILRLRASPAVSYPAIADFLLRHFPGPVRRVCRWKYRLAVGYVAGCGTEAQRGSDCDDREEEAGGDEGGGGMTVVEDVSGEKEGERQKAAEAEAGLREWVRVYLQRRVEDEERNSGEVWREVVEWEDQRVWQVLKLCGLEGSGYEVRLPEEVKVQALWKMQGNWKLGSMPDERREGRVVDVEMMKMESLRRGQHTLKDEERKELIVQNDWEVLGRLRDVGERYKIRASGCQTETKERVEHPDISEETPGNTVMQQPLAAAPTASPPLFINPESLNSTTQPCHFSADKENEQGICQNHRPIFSTSLSIHLNFNLREGPSTPPPDPTTSSSIPIHTPRGPDPCTCGIPGARSGKQGLSRGAGGSVCARWESFEGQMEEVRVLERELRREESLNGDGNGRVMS